MKKRRPRIKVPNHASIVHAVLVGTSSEEPKNMRIVVKPVACMKSITITVGL